MKRTGMIGVVGLALAAPLAAFGQQTSLKGDVVGTWLLVSITAKRDDGSVEPRPAAKGVVTYTPEGRFHFISTLADAPKYASGVRERPTPDEAMLTASTALAYAGTYRVDEGTKTIHADIDTSTFPNFVGAPNQRRIVTSISPDAMTFVNSRTPSGLTLEIRWKRAR